MRVDAHSRYAARTAARLASPLGAGSWEGMQQGVVLQGHLGLWAFGHTVACLELTCGGLMPLGCTVRWVGGSIGAPMGTIEGRLEFVFNHTASGALGPSGARHGMAGGATVNTAQLAVWATAVDESRRVNKHSCGSYFPAANPQKFPKFLWFDRHAR